MPHRSGCTAEVTIRPHRPYETLTAGGDKRIGIADDVIGGERQYHGILVAHLRKCRAAAMAGPESRRIGSSSTSASSPISASCSSTMKRYAMLVMTIGRSNSSASDTRRIVFWNVERIPNNGKNCFGRTSREAGPAASGAADMISGMIRLSSESSNFAVKL